MKGSRICLPKTWLLEFRTCHPKIFHFDCFELWALGNNRHSERLSMNSYLPKDRASKRNSIVVNPVSRSFINQWRLTPITGKETRGQHCTQTTLSQTYAYLLSILLKSHSSFLKKLSPLRGLHPPSPLPMKVVFNPEYYFPWVFSHTCIRYTY